MEGDGSTASTTLHFTAAAGLPAADSAFATANGCMQVRTALPSCQDLTSSFLQNTFTFPHHCLLATHLDGCQACYLQRLLSRPVSLYPVRQWRALCSGAGVGAGRRKHLLLRRRARRAAPPRGPLPPQRHGELCGAEFKRSRMWWGVCSMQTLSAGRLLTIPARLPGLRNVACIAAVGTDPSIASATTATA
jgi:hypothetical protein